MGLSVLTVVTISPLPLELQLLDFISTLQRGVSATAEDKARVDELASSLEARSPNKKALSSPLLNGKWELLWVLNSFQCPEPPLCNSVYSLVLRTSGSDVIGVHAHRYTTSDRCGKPDAGMDSKFVKGPAMSSCVPFRVSCRHSCRLHPQHLGNEPPSFSAAKWAHPSISGCVSEMHLAPRSDMWAQFSWTVASSDTDAENLKAANKESWPFFNQASCWWQC